MLFILKIPTEVKVCFRNADPLASGRMSLGSNNFLVRKGGALFKGHAAVLYRNPSAELLVV